jgi:hypothetical protein
VWDPCAEVASEESDKKSRRETAFSLLGKVGDSMADFFDVGEDARLLVMPAILVELLKVAVDVAFLHDGEVPAGVEIMPCLNTCAAAWQEGRQDAPWSAGCDKVSRPIAPIGRA